MVKKKKDNYKLIKITLLIITVFVGVVTLEVVMVNNTLKQESKTENSETYVEDTSNFYDTSNLTFTNVPVSKTEFGLVDICLNGCNINTQLEEYNYKLIITRNNETLEYTMDIVKDGNAIVENKTLGTNLAGAKMFEYTNYLTIKTEIVKDDFAYDYAIFLDDRAYDEIASLNSKEMELLESGVIYYYDMCMKEEQYNAKKVKAARTPFSEEPIIISSESTNFSWCNN